MIKNDNQISQHRRLAALAALVAFSLLLTACAGAAPREGVLRVAVNRIVQKDPALISSDSEVLLANHVYDYLVDIDPDNQIQPRLATDWTISEDGLTYTFTLAEGVSFHDGSEFNAEDVVWTFDRLRDPANEFATASLYDGIVSIEATGEHEVAFTLSEPSPFFLFDLSDNHALVMNAGTTDPENFNGTGPFQVVSFEEEFRIDLEANEDYFVDAQPKLSAMEFIVFEDEVAAVNALRGGQVDLVLRMSTALFESLKEEPGINTLEIPTNGFDLVRLRADQSPGDDPRVIQALKLATDRKEIFELVQQGYGAVGRDSPIGPLYTTYYSEETPLPSRDVQAAIDLLQKAGYEQGDLQLEMSAPDTGGRPDLAAVIKAQWEEAGVLVDINIVPESVYYGDNLWLEANLGITGWGSRPVPQFYLDTMLVTGARWNESKFSDEELDALAALTGTTLDENERIEAYEEIQRILIERGPVIVPYFFAQFGVIRDQFEGFELKAFAGRTDLRNVSLAQ